MATATMATAAGAAALLYYTLNRRLHSSASQEQDSESSVELAIHAPLGIERISHKLVQAPATWFETISTLSETLKFTYSETLGKWPIGDLAFGINFLLKRQGNLHVGSVFGCKDSVQLMGPEITSELRYLLTLLTLCWHFSKKPFSLFLEEVGCSVENVIIHKPKAGILKPAFTIIIDHKTRCFLLLIRGTHSVKDTLTAATGAVVPFHHSVVSEGGVSDLVLGYAHCGMVAAARWIAKLATPCLSIALGEHPGYTIKIIGHSLGGGTAALLTYILREQKDFAETTCVAFAPAACMSWELAESGTDFITSVINGADLVPTFSAASVDDLRAEVTASAWLNDLRNQIERTRILRSFYRSASALGSHLPSIATARATVAGAGAILGPVSSGTQVVMRRAQSMAQAAWARPGLNFSTWSCMRPRHRPNPAKPDDSRTALHPEDGADLLSGSYESTTTATVIAETEPSSVRTEWSTGCCGIPEGNSGEVAEIMEEQNIAGDGMTEAELWQQLEKGLYSNQGGEGEEAAGMTAAGTGPGEAGCSSGSALSEKEVHRFFPPGKIIHLVTLVNGEGEEGEVQGEARAGAFLTQRLLYSKLRLSQTMISDHFMPAYQRQIERAIVDIERGG